MRQKQAYPLHAVSKYRCYSPTAMKNAFQAVRDTNMSVRRASIQYGVPRTTLKDRVLGNINPETVSSGPAPLFTMEEEGIFIEHLKAMALLGYGYTVSELMIKATNYAVFLNKRTADKPLTEKWYRGLKARWPELKTITPRALASKRAQASSHENIAKYFENLDNVLSANDLKDKPACIYNVDEKGLQTEHSPPKVISCHASTPAIISERTAITTLLGCGNALGTQLPPYFVFKGARMREELLEGATPGTAATVSETGWSNSEVFLKFLQEHFIKYVQRPTAEQPVILLFDGHRSHINIPVINWAKDHNIILFVLPAHTSHLLQPLDVACFGPLQRIYNSQCHKFIRTNPASQITRYNVCKLACAAYTSALSPNNLRAAFRRTGISPFNPDIISSEQVAPSKAYSPNDISLCTSDTSSGLKEFFEKDEEVIFNKQNYEKQKKYNGLSKIVSGTAITEPEIENQIVDNYNQRKRKTTETASGKQKCKDSVQTTCKKQKTVKQNSVNQMKASTISGPQSGPSGLQVIPVDSESASDDDSISEDEKCCVCHLFTPQEQRNCVSLVFTKWAQCDSEGCGHWTHLKFCCDTSVVRRNDLFICPCHKEE